MTQAGIPDIVIMQIDGWKTRSVFDRYNIVSARDMKDAARKLDEQGSSRLNFMGTISDTTTLPEQATEHLSH